MRTHFVYLAHVVYLAHFVYTHSVTFQIDYYNVRQLALLSANAYLQESEFRETDAVFVKDLSLDNDSVRALLFNLHDTYVVAIKGTSLYGLVDGYGLVDNGYGLGSENTPQSVCTPPVCGQGVCSTPSVFSHHYLDKFNDNLLFSCCVYCNANDCKTCAKESLTNPQNYIGMLDTIIQNNPDVFNTPNVIFTGHSLGGALSSITAQKHSKIAVCFQSPGDLWYIQSSEILSQSASTNTPSDKQVYHFGHNADSLFIGNCGSVCTTFGYYIQTKCHSGFTCEYNAQEKLGLRDSLWNHQINYVIDTIIPHWEKDMPQCMYHKECSDIC